MGEYNDVPRVDVGNQRIWFAGGLAVMLECFLIMALLPQGASILHAGWLWMLSLPVISFLMVFFLQTRWAGSDGRVKEEMPVEYRQVMACSLLGGLVLYLVSGSAGDSWSYFIRWIPERGAGVPGSRLQDYGLFRFCVVTAVLVPVIACCRSRFSVLAIVFGILIWTQITAFNHLWQATGGRVLYGNDHANCLYRLSIFSQTFPRLIFYDPSWNAGFDTHSLVSSGIIPLGTVFLPLWKIFQADLVYMSVLATAFIIVIPLMAGLSARLAGGSWTAAGCAAILAIGISQHFFSLLFFDGNAGACFALPFIMLAVACLYRVLWLDCFANSTGIMLVLALLVMLAWPPSAVMVMLFPLVVAFSAQQLSLRRVSFLLLCVVSITAICLPFIMGVLGRIDSLDFMGRSAGRFELTDLFSNALLRLSAQFKQANPCIIFLGVIGVWFLPKKGMVAVFGATMAGLGLLAGCGDIGEQYLQLSNAVMPVFFVALIPASLWMGNWLEDVAPRMTLARAAVITFLLICAVNAVDIYGGRGPAKYSFMNPDVEQVSEWLRKNTSDSSRILIAASPLNEKGKKNSIPFHALANREIMFSDELDYPVEPVPGNEEELMDFMGLYDVSFAVACQGKWKDFLSQDHGHYELVKSFSGEAGFSVFKVRQETGRFVKGGGRVRPGINELVVVLDDPMEESILRYVWQDGLTANPPVEIYPFDTGKDVMFIGVKPHGKSSFKIRYRKLL